ncbi:MAG: DUF975 family protein [Ruminococcaceae bacterium]|nr:DUF975 family protein [Oscillospiraceae bacterium]
MNSRIKLSARSALCGAYGKILPLFCAGFAVFTIFSLCNGVLNRFFAGDGLVLAAVAAVTLPVFVAVISPVRLALQVKHLFLARGTRYGVKPQIGFDGGLKACDLSVRLFAVKAFWFLFFEAIPVCLWFVLLFQIRITDVSVNAAFTVTAGLSLLGIAGFIFWLIFIQRYSKAMFFLACYKDFTPGDALRESVRKTKGNVTDIFLFKLGFLPWFLLCLLVLPAFYVVPYYKQSVTCFFLRR